VKLQREGLMAKVLQAVSGSTADRIAGERDAIAPPGAAARRGY
jgi:hypothetical protein